MLKEMINECRITFSLKTEGPVLIKKPINKNECTEDEKRYYQNIFGLGQNDRLPDAFFVRTLRQGRLVPYVPGSSLKGVMRSHAERIARTLMPSSGTDESTLGCCDIFQSGGLQKGEEIAQDLACSSKFQLYKDYGKGFPLNGEDVYRSSCPVCKLFGNGFLQSRLLIPDGYNHVYHDAQASIIKNSKPQNIRLSKRDGVGIDRYTGGNVSGVKFDFEVEENAVFRFNDIVIKNFDLWQLGLIGYLFQDFKELLIKIGFGKSRGLGTVSGSVEGMKVIHYGQRKPSEGKISGIFHFLRKSEYYTKEEKEMTGGEVDLPALTTPASEGYRRICSFNNKQAEKFLASCCETFSNGSDTGYLNGNLYRIPLEMRKSALENIKGEALEEAKKKEESPVEEENDHG
ncbi:MAG: hypothetical protein HZA01_16805 [Nitrospinae bacterium]|nr:hypothetical protein [Nitrospinota bacterium]